MRSHIRKSLIALLALASLCVGTPTARAASFGVQEGTFQGSTEGAHEQPFTQAAGHPTALTAEFRVNTEGAGRPAGELQRARIDLPVGLVVNPQAVGQQCSKALFEAEGAAAGEGPACPTQSLVGVDRLRLYRGGTEEAVEASVWDLAQPAGLPLELGLYLPEAHARVERLYLEGHISWSSDYHEYLELPVPRTVALVSSQLKLEDAGAPALLTLPSACSASTSWQLTLQSYGGQTSQATRAGSGVTGCEQVPFAPALTAAPETSTYDTPDGLTITATVPQGGETASADIAADRLTLPPGLTLELPAAHVLQACSAAQAAVGQTSSFACPAASQLASATIEAPFLPEALNGGVYLASASGGAITGGTGANGEYPVYLDAESASDGVAVRLNGLITADHAGGRLEVSFSSAPQLPFSELTLRLAGGPDALLANPLVCTTSTLEDALTPYSSLVAVAVPTPFTTGGCPSPLPFELSQSIGDASSQAGAATSFTVDIGRADGEQYLSKLKTVLPAGLVARIATVKPCEEPLVGAGACTGESEIGSASIEAGAGSAPYALAGRAYLTGPYDGAPYGVALAVPAIAGPFDLGMILVRTKLDFEASNGQMTLEGDLPRIIKGIPLRLRSISVTIDRPGFLDDPSACGDFRTLSTLGGFTPGSSAEAKRVLSSPLTIEGCGALAFKPSFSAATNSKVSQATGASLELTLNVPAGDSTVKSMSLQLPRLLLARSGALALACPEGTFEANPYACPADSIVGGVRADAPLLAGKMIGPAISVAHGGASSPDLDLVLEADGVRLILTGTTKTVNHVTSVDYPSEADVPLSSMTLSLNSGAHSALVPNGGLCSLALPMPTTIDSWSGKSFTQKTAVTPLGCGVRIVGHKVIGDTAYLTVKTFSAGRISGSGRDLKTVYRHFNSAKRAVALLVPLSNRARAARRALRIKLRVGFVPKKGGAPSSAFITLKFP